MEWSHCVDGGDMVHGCNLPSVMSFHPQSLWDLVNHLLPQPSGKLPSWLVFFKKKNEITILIVTVQCHKGK